MLFIYSIWISIKKNQYKTVVSDVHLEKLPMYTKDLTDLLDTVLIEIFLILSLLVLLDLTLVKKA